MGLRGLDVLNPYAYEIIWTFGDNARKKSMRKTGDSESELCEVKTGPGVGRFSDSVARQSRCRGPSGVIKVLSCDDFGARACRQWLS